MNAPKTIGRYEILGELGHGAMGTVYRAKDPAMDRIVALKTILIPALAASEGNQLRERFYREARAAGGLGHPGIVPIFDVGEHEGVPFLVMEFVSGRTLAEAIQQGERLPVDRVCEIGRRIADALAYAHQRGVVHRDIKPANILLTSPESHGIERPKIADFGVAKLAEGQTTITGQMMGTPAFMPPEQFTGAPIDGRADLFSLGVVLYWMATGELPFPGESLTSVSYKVVHTDPVPPRKLNPSIPAALDGIIMNCIAKDPADRYQTGEEISRALADVQAGRTTPGLPADTMRTAAPGIDPEATLMGASPVMATARPAARVAPALSTAATAAPAAAAPAKKSGTLVAVLGIAAIVIAIGGFAIWKRGRAEQTPAPQTEANAGAAAPQAAPAPVAAVTAPASVTPGAAPVAAGAAPAAPPQPKKTAAIAKPDASEGTAAGAKPIPAGTPPAAAVPAAAPLDFDPTTLDPKKNSRLKIDVSRTPQNLDLTVEMNGKVYFHRGAGTNQSAYDNYLVPPGVQEFRVVARSGAATKASNTVSANFQAKKRNTLAIELWAQGASTNQLMPQDLYPGSQLVLTLK